MTTAGDLGLTVAPASRRSAAVLPGIGSDLFPACARTVVAPVGDGCEIAYQEEARLVAAAVGRRRREFARGRECAHAALALLGRDGDPIGRGGQREPLWPSGIVGSISHGGGVAGATVAPAAEIWGVGFDIELLDPPLSPDVERLVMGCASPGPPGAGDHPNEPYRSKVAFSAKESVFKCVFPMTRRRLDFSDVTVEIDLGAGRYTAALSDTFAIPGLDLSVLEGRIALTERLLLTASWIPRPLPNH